MKINSLLTLLILVLITSCKKNDLTDVTLNETTKSFTIGQADLLIAKVTATGDIEKFPVTWSTSASSIVTVKDGTITGVAKGVATITATSGDKTASCIVTVGDKIYPVTNEGTLVYWGDNFSTKLSNNVDLYLFGTKDTMVLSFNLPLTVTDSLPVGTYKILSSVAQNEYFIPYTANPTFSDGTYIYGSFYIGATANPVEKGTIVVSSINSNYIIEYELVDYYGNTIYETYQGKLDYYNGTASASIPAAIKKMSKGKTTNTMNKIIKSK